MQFQIFSFRFFPLALCLLIAGMAAEVHAIGFEHSDLLLAYVRASMMMGQPIADEQDQLISKDSTSTSPLPLSGIFSPKRQYRGEYGKDQYRKNPLPPGYSIALQFDSTLSEVRKTESFNDIPTTSGNIIPMDDYLTLRREKERGRLWDSLVRQYDLKKAMSSSDIASVLSQATGLSIPIPPNPLLSIFGKPEISINVAVMSMCEPVGNGIHKRWEQLRHSVKRSQDHSLRKTSISM